MSLSICLFDSITESHVCNSLHEALEDLGCKVISTGPVWHGHTLPGTEDIPAIREQLHAVFDHGIDLLFVNRASALPPNLIREARDRNITTAVWLPDDPVLYDILYKHVVDLYDIVFHCGAETVLDFYDHQGHQPGLNLPFWTSNTFFPYCYSPGKAEFDVLFWGNCTGYGRNARYATIASLPGRNRTYGRIGDDPKGLHGGIVKDINNTEGLVSNTFRQFKIGLNIPQRFTDYEGSPYSFPELKTLGSFQVPSRVIQYAASGLPILSIGDELNHIFPGVQCVNNREEAASALTVLQDEQRLLELSHHVHDTFQRHFSARSRAQFILSVLNGNVAYHKATPATRATLFLNTEDIADSFRPANEQPRIQP